MFTKKITCLEDLSNELFYDIFEFLDLPHVYQAFYSLNARFNRLIIHSTLSIRFNFSSISKPNFEHYKYDIFLPNQHRIYSLYLSNHHLHDSASSPFHTFSQFHCLQTLRLDNIESKQLQTILPSLVSLQYLSSLSIHTLDHVKNKVDVYCEIFRLPALKYCKLSLNTSHYNESIPTSDHTYSPIEHLIIVDGMSIDQIGNLLSYVPQLHRLYVLATISRPISCTKPSSSVLTSLTHLSLDLSSPPFNQFEQLVTNNTFRHVEVLYISIRYNSDRMYTDANKWEQLISLHMPNLRIFDIQHESWSNNNNTSNAQQAVSNISIDQFTSSFWIRRQWFFTKEILQPESASHHSVFYSVKPYRYEMMKSPSFYLLFIKFTL